MKSGQAILVVDDDKVYAKAMGRLLTESGFYVTLAADGQEALDVLSAKAIDLIISDIRMPNMDGIELMKELVQRKIRIPAIFVTAFGEVESYMDLMGLGAFEYINKPIRREEILGVVRKALESAKPVVEPRKDSESDLHI